VPNQSLHPALARHSAEVKHRLMRTNLLLAQRSLIAALNLSVTHFATAGNRGVVDGPDGYANLRKDKRADAPVYESQRKHTAL
jgi:hypothetical protein